MNDSQACCACLTVKYDPEEVETYVEEFGKNMRAMRERWTCTAGCGSHFVRKAAADHEIEKLQRKIYLPGHWQCPKCAFYLVSTNLHVDSGGFSANTEPQQCHNGCGPMWRVTHEQSANTMVDRCEQLRQEVDTYDSVVASRDLEIEQLRSTLGATPCRTLMLQETPYSECFPFHNCEPCTCWRSDTTKKIHPVAHSKSQERRFAHQIPGYDPPRGKGRCPYCDHRIANIELTREDDGELHCNHCRGKRNSD